MFYENGNKAQIIIKAHNLGGIKIAAFRFIKFSGKVESLKSLLFLTYVTFLSAEATLFISESPKGKREPSDIVILHDSSNSIP